MKAATVQELKEELKHLQPAKVLDLCLRLARFKKENKELLTYLLFEAHDEQEFIKGVQHEVDQQFAEIPKGNSLYLVKKTLRKILRGVNKYNRYSGNKTTEAELLLYYIERLKASGIPFQKSPVLVNLYNQQLKKVKAAVSSLHEDLQYDFQQRIEAL